MSASVDHSSIEAELSPISSRRPLDLQIHHCHRTLIPFVAQMICRHQTPFVFFVFTSIHPRFIFSVPLSLLAPISSVFVLFTSRFRIRLVQFRPVLIWFSPLVLICSTIDQFRYRFVPHSSGFHLLCPTDPVSFQDLFSSSLFDSDPSAPNLANLPLMAYFAFHHLSIKLRSS